MHLSIDEQVSPHNVPARRHAQAEQQPNHQAPKVPAVVDHGPLPGPKDKIEAHDERQVAQLAGGPLQRSVPQKVAGRSTCIEPGSSW